MAIEQYRIFWQRKDGTINGKGEASTTLEIASVWVNDCNRNYPEFDHWFAVSSSSFAGVQKLR